jgi:hypothetical protein
VLQTLKRNDIRLVPYVPDRVLTRLILLDLHTDPFFTTFHRPRDEAVGIVSGAWMGGLRGGADADIRLRSLQMCWHRSPSLSDPLIMLFPNAARVVRAVAGLPHHAACLFAGDGASHRDPAR